MQKRAEAFDATSIVASEFACRLTFIQGNFLGTTDDRWLQLFDEFSVPANGTTPLRVWPITTSAPFQQTLDIPLSKGCVLCVSSTRDTKTLSSDTADFFVTYELPRNLDPASLDTVGDYSSTISELEVWTEANGPKRLHAVQGRSGSASDMYVQVHSIDSPVSGETRCVTEVAVPAGASFLLDFAYGLDPSKQPGRSGETGCRILVSTTPGVVTSPGADEFTIKAYYK